MLRRLVSGLSRASRYQKRTGTFPSSGALGSTSRNSAKRPSAGSASPRGAAILAEKYEA
jgi:hypothetical protein